MRKETIRKEAENELHKLGFPPGGYLWQPQRAQLIVVIGGLIKTITLKSGMSRKAFAYEMGKLAGLAEAFLAPRVQHAGMNGAGYGFGLAA